MNDSHWETRLLAILAAVLVVIGLVSVYGASSLVTTQGGEVGAGFFLKQAMGAAVAGIGATILARTDYHVWQRWAWPLMGVTTFLLILPLLPFTHRFTPTLNGARRWVNLGVIMMQPSELAKLAVVCWTAMLAAKKGDQIRTLKLGVVPFLVVLLPVIGFVFLEPNLSMALLIALIAGVVLFAAGARIGHFLLLGVVGTPLVFGAVASAQYRLTRVLTFLNSGSAPAETQSQVYQSLVGIGAGRLIGVGFGQGQQKLGYLAYAYSDFIFSTIAEEWGFLGVLVIVLCFAGIVWLGFRIARTAKDPFGQLLAVGVTTLIGLTAILHICVTLAVLPATGITLPFISYGRTSLFVSLAAMGILISVGHGRAGGGASPSREGSARGRGAKGRG